MRYFNIQTITITTSPFSQSDVNAIRWVVDTLPRGTETAQLNVSLMFVNSQGEINDMIYNYVLYIPKNILDQWLDDVVIDDFIVAESNGLFVKI